MRWVLVALIWMSVSAACIGLFLPWARFSVSAPSVLKMGRVTATVRHDGRLLSAEWPTQLPETVSGVQIPLLAQRQDAQALMAFMELVTGQSRHLRLKSLSVFLVPGLALGCGMLLIRRRITKPLAAAIGLGCAAVAGVGYWKLQTAAAELLIVRLAIGPGLWMSVWAYGGLAAASALRALAKGARA